MDGPHEVATDPKEILHPSVHRREALHVGGGLEAPHLALALPSRLVGDLRAIIRVLVGDVNHRRGVGAGLPGLGAGRGRRSAGQVDAPGRQSQGEVEGSSEVQDQISRWELAGI